MQLCQQIAVTAQGEVRFDGKEMGLEALQTTFACLGAVGRATRGRRGIWEEWRKSCEALAEEARTVLIRYLSNDTDEDELIRSWLMSRTFDRFVSEVLLKLSTPAPIGGPCEVGGNHRAVFDKTGAPFCQNCERPLLV